MVLAQLLAVLAFFVPLAVAYRISTYLTFKRTFAERALETTIGYLLLVQLSVIGMGTTAHLHRTGLIVSLVLMSALGVLATVWRRRHTAPLSSSAPGFARTIVAPSKALFILQLAVTAVLVHPAAKWLRAVFVEPMYLTGDDANYHATISFAWIQQRQFSILPIDIGASFPFGAELLAIWHMLPFGGKSLADMLSWSKLPLASWIVLMILAYVVVTNSLKCLPRSWMFGTLVMLSSSVLFHMNLPSFAAVDNALPGLIVAAFALLVALSNEGSVSSRVEWYSRCGYIAAALGLASGVKFTALPLAAILFAGLTFLAWRSGGWRRAFLTLMSSIGIGFLAGGYWYVRNWLHFGNPLFPVPILGLPGHFFAHDGTIVQYIDRFGWQKALPEIVSVYMSWPKPLAWLALAGLAFGPPLALLTQKHDRRRYALAGALTWAMAFAVLAILPWQAWSAGNGETFPLGIVHGMSLRYITIVPILGWLWLGVALGLPGLPNTARVLLGSCVLVSAAVVLESIHGVVRAGRMIEDYAFWGVIALVLVSIPWRRLALSIETLAPLWASWLTPLLLSWLLVTVFHTQKRNATHHHTLQRPFGRDAHATIQLFQQLPPGRVLGPFAQHLLFGSHLQHQPMFNSPMEGRFVSPGDRFDRSTFGAGLFKGPPDLYKQLELADILLCVNLTAEASQQYVDVVRSHPDFELRDQTGANLLFVRKPPAFAVQPAARAIPN
jgi:hypothetical protein